RRHALPGLAALALLAADVAAADHDLGPRVLRAPVSERVAERGILRPVPLRLAIDPAWRADRVLVHYRLWGNPGWTTLALHRSGAEWEGAIPCLEVSTVTGDLVYYLRVHDADGAVTATVGSRHAPYRVRVVRPRAGDEEADVSDRCPDPADCPAGMPGCPGEALTRVPCRTDADCEGVGTCGWDGFCEDTRRERSSLTIEGEQELGLVAPSLACSLASQERGGTSCIRDDGERYLGNPVPTDEPLTPALGPTRVVLGYEHLVHYGTTVGVRFGVAFRGEAPLAPGGAAFLPLLAEARVAHWFGADPFASERPRPFVALAAGYGMFDLGFPVHVREDPTQASRQGGNDLDQRLTGWKRAGDAFVGGGGGIVVPVGGGVGLSGEALLLQAFPYGATLLVPRAGLRFGW
ncbi:MAG: hypothetical protein FJ104_11700, partial [Deltaproteobacteria bacterium]|nr:hypothetical protein [Deltaproteobacteria bacterium]